MIRFNDVEVFYGEKRALYLPGSLMLKEKRRIGIIGPNGAGKSTLINALLGMVPYRGEITRSFRPEEICVHMQENHYAENISIRDIMEFILGGRLEDNARVMELIAFFDFEKLLKSRFNKLSGGEKQRLTLILVLAQPSELTIFDEVTTGLDFVTRQKLMRLIREWYRDKDTTVVMVSHYYEELEDFVDDIIYLDDGQLLAWGDVRQLYQEKMPFGALILDKEPEEALSCPVVGLENGKWGLLPTSEELLKKMVLSFVDRHKNFRKTDGDLELLSQLIKNEKRGK